MGSVPQRVKKEGGAHPPHLKKIILISFINFLNFQVMQNALELFLRNKNVVSQNHTTIEKYPYRFMRNGIWVTQYVVHLNTYISGLSLRGIIENYENGEVETKLVFSTYGDYHISTEEIKRREKIISHITKHGAVYKEETPIRWFE